MCIKGEFLHRPDFAGAVAISDCPRSRWYRPPVLIPFTKAWVDYAGQVAVLQGRGLVVADPIAAADYLSHVNYYRLSGYCLAFENGARHTFAPGTTFEQIKAAYEFDFALRDLLCEALEVVEVDVRTSVAHRVGHAYGAFGHTDPANFYSPPPHKKGRPATPGQQFIHSDWLANLHRETKRSKELFTVHFKKTYSNFPDLPIWVATEVMSFGSLSRMCEGMKAIDQRAVAGRYQVQPAVLASWAHHLSVVRNHCAHHGRVWDRMWAVCPVLPAGKAWAPPYLADNRRLAATLLILRWLLKRCRAAGTFPDDWRARINNLLTALPAAPNARDKMGLTPDWESGPVWV